MIFDALHTTAISGLETAINTALKYDAGTVRDLSELEGQVLLVDCTMPVMRIAMKQANKKLFYITTGTAMQLSLSKALWLHWRKWQLMPQIPVRLPALM